MVWIPNQYCIHGEGPHHAKLHGAYAMQSSCQLSCPIKNGFECRNKIPDHLCSETTVHFDTENPITWWDWNGTFTRSISFYAEPAWHSFNIFMNQYHSELSTILGSNMNVQCGIDHRHMFYVSLYVLKKHSKKIDVPMLRLQKHCTGVFVIN